MNSANVLAATKVYIQEALLKDMDRFMPKSETPDMLELLRSVAVLVTGDFVSKHLQGLTEEHTTVFQEVGEKAIQALLTNDVPDWLMPELISVCEESRELVKENLDCVGEIDDLFNQALASMDKFAAILYPSRD